MVTATTGARACMIENDILSILHISDFHFTRRRLRDQEVVVNALIEDLKTLCIGHRKPDIVMFTGDLTNAPSADSHAEAYDFFLSPLLQALNRSDERLFIVPGNHDVDQSVINEYESVHHDWRAGDLTSLNAAYEAKEFDEVHRLKFKNYLELESYLSDSTLRYKNVFCSVHFIDALNVNIFVLNSAMLSVGGHKSFERDEGFLAIPEYAILDALKHLQPDSYKVFTTHHPLSAFTEEGARLLRREIQKHADLHLFGHMHDPLTANISSYEGDLYSDQAGAVFTQRRGAYIGYSLICLDRQRKLYETHLRTYFDDRKAFDEARDVVREGKFYSSQEARQFWRGIATPIDDATFKDYLNKEVREHLEKDWQSMGLDVREHRELFISPRLMNVQVVSPDITTGGKAIIEKDVSFDDITEGADNIILYGPPEYGRTTLLREMQFRLLERAVTHENPRLPLLIDFSEIAHSADRLLRTVKSRALGIETKFEPESLLKLGYICLMIDDVEFADAKRMHILREFVARFPHVRYIFSSLKSSAAPYGAHVVPETPVRFEFIELCVLRRKDMRQLVQKLSGGVDVETVLDRLHSEITEINLPFTAANGTILMTIYERQNGFRPINRSVVIEQFIDATLRKAAEDQAQRETFDYANKTALLAHLAGWMASNNQYSPGFEEAREVLRAYLDRLGLNAKLDALIAEFLAARILYRRPDNRVSFRYRAVLEYFIANNMVQDKSFREWVLSEDRYLTFINELNYYSGKLRNDSELVDLIASRFEASITELEEVSGKIDINQIATLKLPRKDGGAVERLSDQLLREPLTREERDEELEGDIPRDVEERQGVFRPRIDHPGHRLLVGILLYSGVVKNMELIEDSEKRRHLANIWRGWAIFLHLSLAIVSELAQHRRLRINGVMYEFNAPIGMSDEELSRIIALNMPASISRIIAGSLGTEKLERQLTEPDFAELNYPLIYEFFRSSLIADLRLDATPGALQAALAALKDSTFLLESLIWKIADLRRMDGIKQAHFDALVADLAGSVARLKGGTPKERGEEKRKQIVRLKREGTLLRIKRQHDDERPPR